MDRNSGLGRQQGRTDFGSKEGARTERRGCVLRCPRAAGFVDTKSFPDAGRAPYTFYDERSEFSPAFFAFSWRYWHRGIAGPVLRPSVFRPTFSVSKSRSDRKGAVCGTGSSLACQYCFRHWIHEGSSGWRQKNSDPFWLVSLRVWAAGIGRKCRILRSRKGGGLRLRDEPDGTGALSQREIPSDR